MKSFYTNIYCLGNKINVKAIIDGKRESYVDEYNPVVFVPTSRKSKFKTLDGQVVGSIRPGNISETRSFIEQNKKLVLETKHPGLDFTLSKPVTVVPILSAINKLDETPLLAWRTAFREVIKLKIQMNNKPTVESRYRLKKWTTLGRGRNAQWVYLGANDAVQFINDGNDVKKSYDFDWIKSYYEEKYG